jgi:hypothetical protein
MDGGIAGTRNTDHKGLGGKDRQIRSLLMKKIKLIFKNSNNNHELCFNLIDSAISHRWLRKLKNIHKAPLSDTDSQLQLETDADRFDIKILHEEFCKLANINFEPLDYDRQENLNLLHVLYEQNHDRLTGQDHRCLYKFHRAIHNIEFTKSDKKKFNSLSFGWQDLEGPLMETINMQEHYCKNLHIGNLYVKWSELGKLPSQYFADGEPNDQTRLNALAKPNKTLRAKFSLQIFDNKFQFTNNFNAWFGKYKTGWLSHHAINDWLPIDEVGGVHVAEPLQDVDLEEFILKYPNFEKIELSL